MSLAPCCLSRQNHNCLSKLLLLHRCSFPMPTEPCLTCHTQPDCHLCLEMTSNNQGACWSWMTREPHCSHRGPNCHRSAAPAALCHLQTVVAGHGSTHLLVFGRR